MVDAGGILENKPVSSMRVTLEGESLVSISTQSLFLFTHLKLSSPFLRIW